MEIVVLAGGVGGARFLTGLRAVTPPSSITAVVNTGDDVTLHGLRICPDLDTVVYTLGGAIDPERGWGRAGESWTVKEELAAYGAEPTWFGLGDRDLATHLVRTRMLDAGYPLSDVTAALADRWQPGITVLPMSDQRVETHVVVDDPDGGRRTAIHFQEWWVRHRAAPEPHAFVQVGAEQARPAPGVVEALARADAVVLAPSNPVVSIGTILGVPGLRDALRAAPGRVVGVSPVVAGGVVRGMADRCLPVLGVEVSAEGVGQHYGARADGGLLDAWLVHTGDPASVPGVDVRAVPLLMSSPEATAAMARAALAAAGVDVDA
ncbi:MAG TPA: 2-phospho-L-lactate transferase [Geodermatophilus sp.]|nr:2-phospho-L-lactate transferase [Geodermatophilus sp.]